MSVRLPRLFKLAALWCASYVATGIFFPIVAATMGVAAAYWVEVYTAVNGLPQEIIHSLDTDLEEEDGKLHRWIDMEIVAGDVKSQMFAKMAVAINAIDPTFWARGAVDKYVAYNGSGTACSFAAPSTLTTALTGACSGGVHPGDRIWARGGTYTTDVSPHRWLITVDGAPDPNGVVGGLNWITLRNYNNEHVKLDCNADFRAANQNHICMAQNNNQGQYWVFWGLDFFNSTTETRYTGVVGGHTIHGNNGLTFMAPGALMINCYFRDMEIGILNNGHNGSSVVTAGIQHGGRGGYGQYNGYIGSDRGYGREWYFKGPDDVGEAGRQVWDDMMSMRAFSNGIQLYATDDTVSYITIKNMVIASSGHGTGSTWSQHGSGWPNFYLGSSGTGVTQCHYSGSKAMYHLIFDNNWSIWGNNSTVFGAAKGSCNSVITDNQFLYDGGTEAMAWASPVFGDPCCTKSGGVCVAGTEYTCNGTWAPVTLTGNTFYEPLPTATGSIGSCPTHDAACADTFTAAHYVNNDYSRVALGFPTSGTLTKYVKNADEQGRGRAYFMNWASAANVSFDPSLAGCFAGEQIKVFNWQNNNPWESTVAQRADGTDATQTGCAVMSLKSTLTAGEMYQPGFTMQDGVTPFAKPQDMGPIAVGFEMYPDWALAVTPTPTNTATNTPSVTRTNTNTATRTSTSTVTNSPTVTGSASPTATNTFTASPTFTKTNTASRTNTPTATNTVTNTPTPVVAQLIREAESCTLTAPMVVGSDSTASSGTYITYTASGLVTPSLGGTAACPFTIPYTADWIVWARFKIPSLTLFASMDSMWFTWDGETPDTPNDYGLFDIREHIHCDDGQADVQLDLSGWYWGEQNNRGKACTSPIDGTVYPAGTVGLDSATTLAAGSHTLTVHGREVSSGVGPYLDKIIVTDNPNYDPRITAGGSTGIIYKRIPRPIPSPTP